MQTTMKTSTAWTVARLNYNEPWQTFLLTSVKPIMDSLSRSGIVERYFWERSYENGAHIRLYFRCEKDVLDSIVIPNLKEHFEAYFESNPSVCQQNNPNREVNNTVQILDYQPDASFWGGEIGLPIVERYFQSSSDAVMEFMNLRGEHWSSDEILATAIELHLGFADALDMDAEEAARFFEYCMLYHSTEDFRLQYFEEYFESQRQSFVGFHSALWEALKSKETFQEDIYNTWLEQCFYTASDLRQTFRRRQLQLEARFGALWTLYARIIRMTNNRLGLFGRDESLVYYVIMRSMEKLCLQNQNELSH
jgi:thiopeptide-type bacteriocin biosynthesis protein